MKYIIMLSLIVGTSAGFAKDVQILSQKQFQSLSQEDQVYYLKGLQKILIKMSAKSPYLAGELRTAGRMPAHESATEDQQSYTQWLTLEEVSPQAKAGNSVAVNPVSAPTPRTRPAQKSSAASNTDSLPSVTHPKTNIPAIPSSPARLKASSPKALPLPSSKISAPAQQNPNHNPTVSPRSASSNDTFETYNHDLANRDAGQALAAPQKQASSSSDTATTEDKKNQEIKRPHFRCMYAGWVVEQDPCSPPEKIPDWMNYEGMEEGNTSCLPGMAACNPVIFGLQLPGNCQKFSDCPGQAKPICIHRGHDATLKCANESAKHDDKATRVAAELNGKINPQHYQRYQSMFKDLCDKEQIKTNPFMDFKNGKRRSAESSRLARQDVQMTCQWAADQVKKLNAFVTSPDSSAQSSPPDSKGGSESQKSGAQQ